MSLQELLDIDVDVFIIGASEMIHRMKAYNRLNRRMMGVKDEDLDHFLNLEKIGEKDQARQYFDENMDKLYPPGNSVPQE